MTQPDFEQLLEIRRLREMRPEERRRLKSWLDSHPEDRVRWEEEDLLSLALEDLPDAEVPTNFTARVWDGIESIPENKGRRFAPAVWMEGIRLLLRKLAWAGAVAVLAAYLWHRESVREMAETAESLVPVVEVAQLPSVAVLRDFDAIRSLGEPMVGGDLELLAVLEDLK